MMPAAFCVAATDGPLSAADLRAIETLSDGCPELRGARVPDDLVCLVRADDGALIGVSTAVPADVELVGGQRFGIYAAAMAPGAEAAGDTLLSATFSALDDAHAGAPEEPIGLCLLVADPSEMERRPEALWEDPPMYYVGYLDDGRQVRVGYFEGARVRELEERG